MFFRLLIIFGSGDDARNFLSSEELSRVVTSVSPIRENPRRFLLLFSREIEFFCFVLRFRKSLFQASEVSRDLDCPEEVGFASFLGILVIELFVWHVGF